MSDLLHFSHLAVFKSVGSVNLQVSQVLTSQAKAQEEGVLRSPPVQNHPGVIVQSGSQPSFMIALPSSHFSLPAFKPSMQIGEQTDFCSLTCVQLNGFSYWQVLLHPSSSTKFPSSHYSLGPSRMPSPQTG